MEFAPAPASWNDGDRVSHLALRDPPDDEHALGGVVTVWALALAAAAAVAAAAGAVVVGPPTAPAVVVGVVVLDGVVFSSAFLDAVGDAELHAVATSATAASPSARLDHRVRRSARARPPWGSWSRRQTAARCTCAPLDGRAEASVPPAVFQVNLADL